MSAETPKDMSIYRNIAEQVVTFLRETPLVGDAQADDADSSDGPVVELDIDALRKSVKEALITAFPDNRPFRTFPGKLDERLIAAAILMQLLPCRFAISDPSIIGYVRLETVGKMIARDLGVPRSAFHPGIYTQSSVIAW